MKIFHLEKNEFIELKNLLKLIDWCESGGAASTAISGGLVKVDGKVELRKRCKLRVGQVVSFENQEVKIEK
ncbi:MAG: RNA-binding protein [Deltaproteobacteria bacterium CG_4_10_14_0_2_um_filter_43_8]|nr:MAG: RNA-binding protein [Deltaproteobacteria bacterium CG11_big_fil_rev_8_21_14_0_20_42_23]PJA22120.1 MAG: RNA-binding protein [Deltaproteobacteria bacterium CG_4_10_14_0_2_um_filter_43_8]PJC64826.1 MAG: RNA-binding protein [Deltaproteobacteria bacterium CG_4_9_14_0_2_um_filter_42_21]